LLQGLERGAWMSKGLVVIILKPATWARVSLQLRRIWSFTRANGEEVLR